MNRNRFLLRSVLAAGDQAVVSLANLAVGLAFVKFAPKAEYGQYSMIFAGFLLGQSLQNAAFLSPLLTVLPGLPVHQREAALRKLMSVQAAFVILLAAFGGLAYAFFGHRTEVEPLPAMAVVAAVIGVLAREAVRGTQYATQRVVGAFAGSLLYALVMAIGLVVIIWSHKFTLLNVLLLTAAAGIASMLVIAFDRGFTRSQATGECPSRLGVQIWDCAKWALPSVVVSWLCSFAYVYPLGWFAGAAAVADVSAARLFLVPVSLLVTGWANVFRPRASHLLAERRIRELETLASRSALALVIVTILLGAVVSLLLPTFERAFAKQYAGLMPIVAAWTLYFCTQTVRSVGMSAMLGSKAGFKPLHTFGWLALAATVPAVVIACLLKSAVGVVAALITGELVLLMLIHRRGWPSIKAAIDARRDEPT